MSSVLVLLGCPLAIIGCTPPAKTGEAPKPHLTAVSDASAKPSDASAAQAEPDAQPSAPAPAAKPKTQVATGKTGSGFRRAGRGDVVPPASVARAARKRIDKAQPKQKIGRALRLDWARRLGTGEPALHAGVFRSHNPEGEGGGGSVVFTLSEDSGRLLSAERNFWVGAFSRKPFRLQALPDRDLDGDGEDELALVMATDSAHGGWAVVALYTTKHPQLIVDEYYSFWAEATASGNDWRYACTKNIDGHLGLMIYERRRTWDEAQKESSVLSIRLLGKRPPGAANTLFAVEIAGHRHRKPLLPMWAKAAGTTTAKPFAWPANEAKLRELSHCPGAGAPVVVHKSVIKGARGKLRFRLIRDVTWNREAAERAAQQAGGTLVELRRRTRP